MDMCDFEMQSTELEIGDGPILSIGFKDNNPSESPDDKVAVKVEIDISMFGSVEVETAISNKVAEALFNQLKEILGH